jgi:prepilin-type N-terminal cleavage/methylation domain-containing protein
MIQTPLSSPAAGNEAGFTLVELMLALMVLTIGVLGMASTMASMIRYQDLSQVQADMTALGDHKIEQLRVVATHTPAQLAPGGDLNVHTLLYCDTVVERGRTFFRLWTVAAGPGGTQQVTVRVRPAVDDARTPAQLDFNTLIQIMTAD